MVVKAEHPGPLQKKAQKAPREPLDPNMMSFPLMMSHRTSRPKSAYPHFLDFLPPANEPTCVNKGFSQPIVGAGCSVSVLWQGCATRQCDRVAKVMD